MNYIFILLYNWNTIDLWIIKKNSPHLINMFLFRYTLFSRREYLRTLPRTVEQSRHTSRGQRLSPLNACSLNYRALPVQLDLVK